jgi:hypothetical protein
MNASLIHVMLRPHVKIFLEALHAHATSVFLEMGLIVLVSMNKRSFAAEVKIFTNCAIHLEANYTDRRDFLRNYTDHILKLEI